MLDAASNGPTRGDVVSQTATLPVTGIEMTEEPGVLETYSLVYSFVLLFLIPGVALMSRLPFGDARSDTYTPAYVSLVTVPFLLGVALTFVLDSPEGLKRAGLRILVLTPLVVLTGVTLMFGISMVMIPASKLLGIRDQGLTWLFWLGLVVAAAPLVITLARRLKRPAGARGVAEIVAIAFALLLIAGLAVFSFTVEASVYDLVRKDVVIYLVGALTWYLPAFGLAAGFWRRTGLV
jgi:hypothetical protein